MELRPRRRDVGVEARFRDLYERMLRDVYGFLSLGSVVIEHSRKT